MTRPPRDHLRVPCVDPGGEGGGRGVQYGVARERSRAAAGSAQARDRLASFRRELYGCFTARADALLQLAEAGVCPGGPVKTLVGLSLAAEHHRRPRAL